MQTGERTDGSVYTGRYDAKVAPETWARGTIVLAKRSSVSLALDLSGVLGSAHVLPGRAVATDVSAPVPADARVCGSGSTGVSLPFLVFAPGNGRISKSIRPLSCSSICKPHFCWYTHYQHSRRSLKNRLPGRVASVVRTRPLLSLGLTCFCSSDVFRCAQKAPSGPIHSGGRRGSDGERTIAPYSALLRAT
jgi:hypothetical protein